MATSKSSPATSTRCSTSCSSAPRRSNAVPSTPAGSAICSARGAAGKHGSCLHPHQRVIAVASVGQLDLDADRDRPDPGAVVGDVQRIDAAEELERHATTHERLVQRREDDVTHPGGHLPEDGPLEVEEGLARQEHAPAGPERRVLRIAVDVGEDEVVQPADERRPDGLRRRAVSGHPRPVVLVVDRGEAALVGQQPVGDDAARRRQHDGEQVRSTPGALVALRRSVDGLTQAGERVVDRRQRRRAARLR